MKKSNLLANEKSPYLLQHANNPINWYPWCDDAFDKAKEKDIPIFLSIGYSTCHWCHVMERESFEDEAIADILNEHFVAIKVDREERPDIDAVYMNVCQAMTGGGGWPLTIIMTASAQPFFAGTYLPKRNAFGRMGLYELLEYVQSMWVRDRQKLVSSSDKILDFLRSQEKHKDKGRNDNVPEILQKAVRQYESAFDKENGGFGGAPKFPSAHNLLFLINYAQAKGQHKIMSMAEKTLVQMYRGGIYDHIEGGFSRYSTDVRWLVPHFEKMLYDNALLIEAYATFIENSQDIALIQLFTDIIVKSIDYCNTRLRHKDGGYACAQDADIDGVEGEYYWLTTAQVYEALEEQDAQHFCREFGITDQKSVPNLLHNSNYINAGREIDGFRDKLIRYRQDRATLFTDDKILTAWNALMISALAKAYKVLKRKDYLEYAISAVEFIEKNLVDGDNLYVVWCDGVKKTLGLVDDYAYYAKALIDMYKCTFETKYLAKAARIAEIIPDMFGGDGNGLYLYSNTVSQLILRPKVYYDGAMPSGNSVAADVFNLLFKLTADVKWQQGIKTQFEAIIPQTEQYAMGYGYALKAMTNIAYPRPELIVVSNGNVDYQFLLSLKNIDIVVKTAENKDELAKIAPFSVNYGLVEGTAYYYCYKGECKQPVFSQQELLDIVNMQELV